MSNPYPSRRELRLQREREERASLRDQEAQRWAEEVEAREQRAAVAQRQADETLAKAELVPANQAHEASQPHGAIETDHQESPAGRRAAAKPVDSASDPVATDETTIVPRRRRRADSHVTSTGMLPLITKQRDESKPRSRKEARAQAERASAEREAKIEALEHQAEKQQAVPAKPVRRATAPQAPPPPVPAATEAPVDTETSADGAESTDSSEDTVVVSTSEFYTESATEITDMTGLDTIEVRRAELRAETEKLTQEIIELGQENPNVIDPLLLRRQKELAEKSQELQNLETAAVTIIEDDKTEASHVDAPEGSGQDLEVAEDTAEAGLATTKHTASAQHSSDDDVEVESVTGSDAAASEEPEEELQPGRRARRASNGPKISGPFEVTEDDDAEAVEAETKPDFASHFEPQAETDAIPSTGPEKPLEASSAHGLDTLDPKESEAPERRLLAISMIVFAVGIVALIIALILFTR